MKRQTKSHALKNDKKIEREMMKASTMSISMSGGNMEFPCREDDKVRGCPGKRPLCLVILPDGGDRATYPLRGAFEEDREAVCLSMLDIDLCAKACKLFSNTIQKINQTILYTFIIITISWAR